MQRVQLARLWEVALEVRSVDLDLRQEPGVSAVARSGMSKKRVGGAVLLAGRLTA